MSKLYELVRWARITGDEQVLARMRVLCLSALVEEGIALDDIDRSTDCSVECFLKIKASAERVTKQRSPF
ncbi:MAG: hypothetical protein HRU20_00810 [Pseudomonadales bacterium]|nr:hypothetical protein [Pseudomonadales bacterium]